MEKGVEGDEKRCHDYKMRKKKRLLDEYRFPGFRPKAEIKGIFGDSTVRVIRLVRTQKNGMCLLWYSASELLRQESASSARFVLWRDADLSGGGDSACPVSEMREGETGGVGVAFEKSFLHKEVCFSFDKLRTGFVGRRCRSMTIQDVAKELKLDWHTVKELDKQYMEKQLQRTGVPAPEAIGIDEISLRKGHTYRIVVSDLERKRPIWFGGKDGSEGSLDTFYEWAWTKEDKKDTVGGYGYVEGI